MKRYIPATEPNIRIHGRTVVADPLPLFWTGSGIELLTTGTELFLELESDFQDFEQWIRVEVDGYPMIRMPLGRGKTEVKVYRRTDADRPKRVRLFKEVQAMPDDKKAMLLVHGVLTDGELLPLPERKMKIEFVGDSITSGEGMAGSVETGDWVSSLFSTKDHYVLKTGELLDADVRFLSQSGWGTYCSWDNHPEHAMPAYYPLICGVLKGEQNAKLGAFEQNDFESWKPDVIVVNLGTNDAEAYNQPAYVDPEGNVYKQTRLEDGSFDPESVKRFQDAAVLFLQDLRAYNPQARILWVYGMLGTPLEAQLLEAISFYREKSGDEKVEYLRLPDLQQGWYGSNGHPGVGSHKAAAEAIAEFLNK